VSAGGSLVACATLLAIASTAHAQTVGDSAQVLPRGLFRADVHHVYTSTGLRSRRGGLEEQGPSDAAQFVTELVGGASDFGNATISYQGSAQLIVPGLFYGVHERLTVGFIVPVFLDARVDLHELQVGTGAIGYNPDYSKDPSRQAPVLSAQDPRAVLGAEGIRQMLSETFQYEPLQSWESSGLGDVQAFARASILSGEVIRLAAQGGLSVPTGQTDDIDNLVDFGLGSGQVDLAGFGLLDIIASPNLILNLRGGYTFQLPNEQDARVYNYGSVPIAPIDPLPGDLSALGQRRHVVRDLGNLWQVGSTVHLMRGSWVASAAYDYIAKGEDHYYSDEGEHPAMRLGTDYSIHTVGGMAGINLVQSYLRGSAPLPLAFDVTVSRSISDFEAANMTAVISRMTLYFGPADSARGAK